MIKAIRIVLAAFLIQGILISCAKKVDKYIAVNKDMLVLHENWKIGGANLRDNVITFKEDMKNLGKLQQELTKLSSSKNLKTQKEIQPLLEESKLGYDSLKNQMANLNLYVQEWKTKSQSLNELTQLLKDKKISPEEGTKRIAELRAFKALADPKLEAIRFDLEKYRTRNLEVKTQVTKFYKKKA